MWLNMSISAVVGIVGFFLAVLPNSPGYYQVPMSIMGGVYANSVLVLINSRIQLGSEESPSVIVSAMKFHTASSNNTIYNGDCSVDDSE